MNTKHPLLNVLRSRNDSLGTRASQLIERALPLLKYTVSTFPSGTRHGPEHTTTVELIARMLLPDDFLSQLTDDELYFLVLACHYHDLGMAGTEADDRTAAGREQVRREHAVRIGERIKTEWKEFGFESENEAGILGEICRGHRPPKGGDGHASWDNLPAFGIISVNRPVRIRLISASIYAIDELHIGADRAPKRDQDWREIVDEEARRHWRRHQAIQGPVAVRPGILHFSVTAITPGFEEDLRRNVLAKALGAVRDFREQSNKDGIQTKPPGIGIQWIRDELWELLFLIAMADLKPRTREEIEADVMTAFGKFPRTNLDELCIEQGSAEAELQAGIWSCIDKAITQNVLVPIANQIDHLILGVDERTSVDVFKKMKNADELDRLFWGQYHAHWQIQFYVSGYGREYVRSLVFPSLHAAYGVNLATHSGGSPARSILESTPTAMRVAMDNRLEPSNLETISEPKPIVFRT